ncbi:hypothetical protein AMS68_004532 [Peltaster fructicola]|uniref:Association with the SNF1 complex (ASC) domain-containing protein n=1 Tax=Peltaster fructicola TaxID=286661 RepID=A0A6H0XWH9_9PEZI|nr:hypothetical protein AMS68_004532 [Peltaster fructicola]
MGTSQSTEQKPNSIPASPASSAPGKQQVARRKESAQTLSQTSSRSSNAPTAALISTSSPSTSIAQPTKAHAIVTQSPAASHTRARSITAPIPPHVTAENATDSLKSGSPGSEHAPASRASTLPLPHATPPEVDAAPSPVSRPVDVPSSHNTHHEPDDFIPSGLPSDESPYGHITSTFSRPPRLPLPIEEEAHAPGSPIISPHDISTPLDEKEVEGGLPRRTSVLSSTTADDDEIGEHDLYQGDQSGPTVPTIIEWKGEGGKVFVTGTFVMWERKFKLHRNKDTGTFSTILQLKPGTHHIKFLVDDDMITSPDLPTTVDFTNILVNYIEIVAPHPGPDDEPEPRPSEPVDIPGAATTAGQAEGTDQPAATPIPIRGAQVDSDTVSPQPASVREPIPIPASVPRSKAPSPTINAKDEAEEKPPKQFVPRGEYTREIPQFLLDLDRYATPEDERFQRASRVSNTLPHPPSLPMFLGKSILNGATPHKDDASVLIMPNHTVLNHLATSSIRSGVLATSGTTRYKRKFLTTIMYRPTSDDS